MEKESVLAILTFIDEVGIEHAKWRVVKALQAYLVDLDRIATLEAENNQLVIDAYKLKA